MLRSKRIAQELLVGVSVVALVAACTTPVLAQTASSVSPSSTLRLDEVVISSDKAEGTTVYDSPATVTVRSAEDINRQNINSPRDLVRDEPGISVGNQPTRTGTTNYVIRGIGENRVRLEIDGVKVPDYPASNAGAGTYTRDFVDFDSLERVEIVRGPASALYGSDAIGGVVSYVTKDPADYQSIFNKDYYISQKMGFDSVDRSLHMTTTGAKRVGDWETMLLYTRRQGHEVTPNTYLSANPQSYVSQNMLGKLVYNHAILGQFKFTAEYLRKKTDTDLNTEEVTSMGTRVFDSGARDTNGRQRYSLDWHYPVNGFLADTVDSKLYWTSVDRREVTDQLRGTGVPAPTTLRHTDSSFNQSIFGGELRFNFLRKWAGWDHQVTYGLTADATNTQRPRNRYQLTLATGVVTFSNIAGESYPNKNFPDTTTQNAGFYVQDIIQRGPLRIIPAVRFDYYHLNPHPDADFNRGNLTGIAVSPQTETAVSPKLGATYDLTDNYRVFAQYAHGFRAPPYDNANFGFRNTTSFYEILPNANLKPETSEGFEGGLRGRFNNGSSFQVSAYYNSYKDFIDTVTIVAPPPPGLTQFQYRNLSNVRIYGFEGKGEWRFAPVWSLFGSFAYANGINQDTGAPIDSVDPFTAVGGLRYRANGWTNEVRARWVAEKNRVSGPTVFVVPAHTTVDTLVSYEFNKHFTVNAGIYNLFDTSYYDPQNVQALLRTTANLDLYRAPGRTFAINATLQF